MGTNGPKARAAADGHVGEHPLRYALGVAQVQVQFRPARMQSSGEQGDDLVWIHVGDGRFHTRQAGNEYERYGVGVPEGGAQAQLRRAYPE